MNYKFSLEFLKLPLESGLEEYLRRKNDEGGIEQPFAILINEELKSIRKAKIKYIQQKILLYKYYYENMLLDCL